VFRSIFANSYKVREDFMDMNGTTIIAKPSKDVFAYILDVTNDVNWRTGVTESGLRSGDTVEVGTIGYVKAEDQEVQYRVISYSENESVDWELLNGPFLGTGGYRLVPVENGTQFTLVSDVKPTGFLRLLGPLFGWMGKRQNQADVNKLRDILESA
jgi:hypothetical protein